MVPKTRCSWPGKDPIYVDYHDREWGVPVYDEKALFEKLILDGFQAGLSWITILRKRENFIRAFDGFEPEVIACYGPEKIKMLMEDSGIVRNRQKIESTILNARVWLELRESGMNFSDFLWQFVGGKPKRNSWNSMDEVPAESSESRAMSQTLRKAGFRFCGPTICYAFMQAVGMVNDHTTECFRYKELYLEPTT